MNAALSAVAPGLKSGIVGLKEGEKQGEMERRTKKGRMKERGGKFGPGKSRMPPRLRRESSTRRHKPYIPEGDVEVNVLMLAHPKITLIGPRFFSVCVHGTSFQSDPPPPFKQALD